MMESVDRSKVRNPSPPPGYIRPNPHIGLRPDLAEIDGQIFKFLALTIESGILEDSNPSSDFSVPNSDDDDVLYVPVAPKVPPVIDLDEECVNLSDGEIPDDPEVPPVIKAETYPKKQPAETKKILDARHHSKAVKKDIIPPSIKVKKHHSKKKVVDYSSDSSTESSHSKKKKKTRRIHRSRSPSSPKHEDSDNKDQKYNSTDIKQEDNLYGSFHCSVCKLTMNAEGSYESHLNGKRHMKAVKSQRENLAHTVENSIVVNIPSGKSSRYPIAPASVIRMRVQETALIQRVVEDRVENPCPGLQNVIEIQEQDDTHYYCELCNAPCSSNSIIPHLRGRKHQLSCLEFFDIRAYLSIKDKSNREIDNVLHRLLRSIQNSHGRGRITVERDMERKDYRDFYSSHADRASRREDIPGPSRHYDKPVDRLPASFQKTMIPDTSKSDFYCKFCDSHMNNINMWEAHVRGKRHLRNVKKAPGEGPSKTKSYPLPDARAYVMDDLEHVGEPVVGLQFIRETRNPEVGGATYNCFPCGACLTQLDIVDHILTQKHRTKFLEKIEHPYWLTMKQMDIQGAHLGSIIEEACATEQNKNGSGKMEVHIMKGAVVGCVGSGRW